MYGYSIRTCTVFDSLNSLAFISLKSIVYRLSLREQFVFEPGVLTVKYSMYVRTYVCTYICMYVRMYV